MADATRYDADLVTAVLERRSQMPPQQQHTINNIILQYMAYSGYYGVLEVVELKKAHEMEELLKSWLK